MTSGGGRVAAVAVAVVVGGYLVGCDGSPPARPSASASGHPSASARATTPAAVPGEGPPRPWVATTVPAPTRTLTVAAARPAGAHLAGLGRAPMGDPKTDWRVSTLDLLDDGRALAVRTPPFVDAEDDLGMVIQPSTIGFASGGRYTAIAKSGREASGTMKGRNRQIFGATSNGRDVVWVETPSTDLGLIEWSIRSYQASTGTVREIAHSPVLSHGDRYVDIDSGTYPRILGAYAYWATAVSKSSRPDPARVKDWGFAIERARLDGRGKVQTVATQAAYVAVADGALFYATRIGAGKAFRGYVLHRRAGGDGPDEPLVRGTVNPGSTLANLAAGSGQLVWTVNTPDYDSSFAQGRSTPGRIYLLDLATRQVTQIVTADDAGPNSSFAFGPGRVLWGNGSGNGDPSEYVLELGTGQIFRLGAQRGYSVVYAERTGSKIIWYDGCPTATEQDRTCSVTADWKS